LDVLSIEDDAFELSPTPKEGRVHLKRRVAPPSLASGVDAAMGDLARGEEREELSGEEKEEVLTRLRGLRGHRVDGGEGRAEDEVRKKEGEAVVAFDVSVESMGQKKVVFVHIRHSEVSEEAFLVV